MGTEDRRFLDGLVATVVERAEKVLLRKRVDPGIYGRVQVDSSGLIIKGWADDKSIVWYCDGALTDIVTAHGGDPTHISATFQLSSTYRLRPGLSATSPDRLVGFYAVTPPGSGQTVVFDVQLSANGTTWNTIFDVDAGFLPEIVDTDNTLHNIDAVKSLVEGPSDPHPDSPITLPADYWIRLDVTEAPAEACELARFTFMLICDVVS